MSANEYKLFGYFDDNSNLSFLKSFFEKNKIDYKLTKINSIIDPLIVGQFLEPKYQLEIPLEHYEESINLFNDEMEKTFSKEDVQNHIMNAMDNNELVQTILNATDPEATFIANKILKNRGMKKNSIDEKVQIIKDNDQLDERSKKSFNFWFAIIIIIILGYFLIHFIGN